MATPRWKRISVVLLFCAMGAIASPAQTLTTLFSFDGPTFPSNLVQGTDGSLYGTTLQDGTNDQSTVFKVTPSGTLTTLYGFSSRVYASGLVQGTDGNLYGTTEFGGVNVCPGWPGCGMVFKINPAGEFARLYSFCSRPNCRDGRFGGAALVQGTDGNFYGTTVQGGVNSCLGATGCGVVFKITPSGELTTLYSFCRRHDCTDGEFPGAGLVQATNGNFYGMTLAGGGTNLYGTFFKITAAGTLTTLHRFHLPAGGSGAGLIQATDGNFYGTSYDGGGTNCPNSYGCGSVFRITPAGAQKRLYSFCMQPNCADGMNPSGLVQATDGSLYGTTYYGGNGFNGNFSSGAGTVFKITNAGELTTLYSFCSQANCTDGGGPAGALVQATDGNFYGATDLGGADYSGCGGFGCGTVFSLSVGLRPFVSLVRDSGEVGQIAEILGQGFTGTTGVSFNGTAASFKVINDTFMTATVPAGAETGPVMVSTPSGTLTSNLPFRVQR